MNHSKLETTGNKKNGSRGHRSCPRSVNSLAGGERHSSNEQLEEKKKQQQIFDHVELTDCIANVHLVYLSKALK